MLLRTCQNRPIWSLSLSHTPTHTHTHIFSLTKADRLLLQLQWGKKNISFKIYELYHCSVTRWSDCLFKFWPFTMKKICPTAKNCLKKFWNCAEPQKCNQRLLKFCQRGEISPIWSHCLSLQCNLMTSFELSPKLMNTN